MQNTLKTSCVLGSKDNLRRLFKKKYGSPASGLVITTSCANKKCSNVDHATLMSRSDIAKRSVLIGTHKTPWGNRDRCARGHVYTTQSTYVWNKQRICKICRDARQKKYKARNGF